MNLKSYHVAAFVALVEKNYSGGYEDIPFEYIMEYLKVSDNPFGLDERSTMVSLANGNTLFSFLVNQSKDSDKFWEMISSKHIDFLNGKNQIKVMEDLLELDVPLKRLEYIFECGWNVSQGYNVDSYEMDLALSGNIKFFQLAEKYLKFDFTRKYQDLHNGECFIDEYMQELKCDKGKHEPLMSYLQITRTKQQLENDLSGSNEKVKRNKI